VHFAVREDEAMMTRKRRAKIDPIEQEIEVVLNPGAFIPDRDCFSFVSDLDEVAAKIAKLTASYPSRAAILYETKANTTTPRCRTSRVPSVASRAPGLPPNGRRP
jgi:hypothetical protein